MVHTNDAYPLGRLASPLAASPQGFLHLPTHLMSEAPLCTVEMEAPEVEHCLA